MLKTLLISVALLSIQSVGFVSLVQAPIHYNFAKKPRKKISLNKQLRVISLIESSGGLNKNHKQTTIGMNRGCYAAGSTGLMPLTILETIHKNHFLFNKYNILTKMKMSSITKFINKNAEVEIEIANVHWDDLGRLFGNNSSRKAYAWRKGIHAAMIASSEEIHSHPYVIKFNKYLRSLL